MTRQPRAARELLLVLLLWAGYSLARLLGGDSPSVAHANARRLLAWERGLRIDVEAPLNTWTRRHELVEIASAYWYSTTHYVVTATALVLLWRRRPDRYPQSRTVLVLATLAALAFYLLLPLAPPRLLPGYTDTLRSTAQWGWWGGDASAPRAVGGLTNEYAAMPSMHVGWAVWTALVLGYLTTRRWLRVLLWLYPLTTAAAVVLTANHWVADVLAGAALVLLFQVLTELPVRPLGRASPSRPDG